jgi:hypothetical protein
MRVVFVSGLEAIALHVLAETAIARICVMKPDESGQPVYYSLDRVMKER